MRLALSLGLVMLALPALAAEPSAQRQEQLRDIVSQDCGSCHGMTRKGGLGPALLPEALARYDAEAVAATILDGRPGTPMPPWKTMLGQDDARWIAAYLMGETK